VVVEEGQQQQLSEATERATDGEEEGWEKDPWRLQRMDQVIDSASLTPVCASLL
jgi:hypothetical protein